MSPRINGATDGYLSMPFELKRTHVSIAFELLDPFCYLRGCCIHDSKKYNIFESLSYEKVSYFTSVYLMKLQSV